MSGPIRPIHEGSNARQITGLSRDINVDRESARAVARDLEDLLAQILLRTPVTTHLDTVFNLDANTLTMLFARPEGRARSVEAPLRVEIGSSRDMDEVFNTYIATVLQKVEAGKFIHNEEIKLLPPDEGQQKMAIFVIDNKRKEITSVEDIVIAADEAFALGELNQKKKELEEVNSSKQKVTAEIHTQTANPADKLQQASRLLQQRLELLNKQEEALRADIQRLEEKRDTAKLEKTYYEKT